MGKSLCWNSSSTSNHHPAEPFPLKGSVKDHPYEVERTNSGTRLRLRVRPYSWVTCYLERFSRWPELSRSKDPQEFRALVDECVQECLRFDQLVTDRDRTGEVPFEDRLHYWELCQPRPPKRQDKRPSGAVLHALLQDCRGLRSDELTKQHLERVLKRLADEGGRRESPAQKTINGRWARLRNVLTGITTMSDGAYRAPSMPDVPTSSSSPADRSATSAQFARAVGVLAESQAPDAGLVALGVLIAYLFGFTVEDLVSLKEGHWNLKKWVVKRPTAPWQEVPIPTWFRPIAQLLAARSWPCFAAGGDVLKDVERMKKRFQRAGICFSALRGLRIDHLVQAGLDRRLAEQHFRQRPPAECPDGWKLSSAERGALADAMEALPTELEPLVGKALAYFEEHDGGQTPTELSPAPEREGVVA